MRYDQLIVLASIYKPRTIIEVGTNRGDRGLAICEEALKHRRNVHYRGYDVFDTEPLEFHERAFNGKGFFPMGVVAARFEELVLRHSGFSYQLVQGRTEDTLHPKPCKADLAFVDGDHRLDTIRKDYKALRGSRVIVFDDYYVHVEGHGEVNVGELGCNGIIGNLHGTVLPIGDRFPHTGEIKMAAVIRRHLFLWGKPLWLP